MRALSAAGIALALALGAGAARAEPSEADRALAQAQFDQGRALMQAGKYAEACDAFLRSQRLDPGGGTLLNLAVCHEKAGKTATAYVEFNEALSLALRDGRKDREDLARERLNALAAVLPRARFHSAAPPPPGLALSLDGAPVSTQVLAEGASPIPIDPGAHVVEARAPGRAPARVDVRVATAQEGAIVDVEIPALAESPAAPAEGAPPAAAPVSSPPLVAAPAPESPRTSRRTAASFVGGFGLAALGVGAAFGFDALAKQRTADAACSGSRCADASAVSASEHAVTSAWISNVAIGAGLVALGVGVYLYVTSPR